MMLGKLLRTFAACFVAMFVLTESVFTQDSLNAARDLYASAAYEDALTVLNRLRVADRSTDEARAIEQYRAFCLLALGRSDEAERAIEAVIAAQPSYRPSESDVSPRLRAAFRDVRRRMLPGIIQERYAAAKTAFDGRDYATAAQGFRQVLEVLADADVGAAANQAPLSDLRVLAIGFEELSAKAVPPPPAAPPLQPVPSSPVVVAPAPPVPLPPQPPRIYGPDDPGIVPPATVSQTFPTFPGRVLAGAIGVIEIIVNETGGVESAMLRVRVHPAYDELVLASARTWLYRPALLGDTPVKYRKLIQVVLKPTR